MENPKDSRDRMFKWIAASAIILAVVLYFVGTSESDFALKTGVTPPVPFDGDPLDAATLRSYPELRSTPMYPAVNSWLKDLVQLEADTPRDLREAKPIPDELKEAARKEVIANRAEGRAFDGAPPTVPHPVIQTEYPDCLVCHEKGIKIRDRIAPRISHRVQKNCSQCHTNRQSQVPKRKMPLPENHIAVENAFVGMLPDLFGPRAWNIAPPQIPHSTLMRENCDSCHGTLGYTALRTPHPGRSNCTQCHTSSAALDQRPAFLSSVISEE